MEATININISGTAAEVRKAMREFLGAPGDLKIGFEVKEYKAEDKTIEAVGYSEADKSLAEEVEEKKERKPRGPNKKKEETKVEAPTPPPATTPSDEAPTLDNCRNWVKAIAASKTLEAAQNVVIAFGVAKVGELPETKYAEFIKACKEVLA